jgi:hypothetical protein
MYNVFASQQILVIQGDHQASHFALTLYLSVAISLISQPHTILGEVMCH